MFNFSNIERLKEEIVKENAEEMLNIKGFHAYLIDFNDSNKQFYGYSIIIYKNNHAIHYANDYELHHKHMMEEKGKEALRDFYIKRANNILFSDEEITGPVKDYDDFKRKEYFLINYYCLQEDYISAFNIFHNDEERDAFHKSIESLYYNKVSFCYMADKDFINHQINLYEALKSQMAQMSNNFEYYKEAFLHEMYNHEYSINWQADYDTLSAFGKVEWHEDDLNAYFDELNFSKVQRNAYLEARKSYFAKQTA